MIFKCQSAPEQKGANGEKSDGELVINYTPPIRTVFIGVPRSMAADM